MNLERKGGWDKGLGVGVVLWWAFLDFFISFYFIKYVYVYVMYIYMGFMFEFIHLGIVLNCFCVKTSMYEYSYFDYIVCLQRRI